MLAIEALKSSWRSKMLISRKLSLSKVINTVFMCKKGDLLSTVKKLFSISAQKNCEKIHVFREILKKKENRICKSWIECKIIVIFRHIYNTLIIPHKNTLIEIKPHLFLTKTANWGSIVLKGFFIYMYDVVLVQPMKILSSTAAIN